MSAQRSIVICGGAFAGLALALALRQGLGPEIPVVVADPALATRPSRDPRATAIIAPRLPSVVRGARRLGPGSGFASHHGHGGDGFEARRCDAASVPDLRRPCR